MLRGISRIGILVACLSLATLAATAQQVVHALVGTVTSINSDTKTISVNTDDGTEGLFKDMSDVKTRIEFDRSVRTDTTAADEFQRSGARVIVYYYGNSDIRTVVALRSLGSGPFTTTIGPVVNFNGGHHTISIKDKSGAVTAFEIDADTVVEGETGAEAGYKFRPEKDDQVHITSKMVNEVPTAVFIYAM
jgi:hypothetical protein